MKKLLISMAMVSLVFAFTSCSDKGESLSDEGLKTDVKTLVANDTKVDNAIEETSYETDVFSLGSSAVTSYGSTLKSAEIADDFIGASRYKEMFNFYPKFKFRYRNGVCPDLSLTTTNGTYPITMMMDYGEGLELTNGRILSGKITIVVSAAPFTSGSTRTMTFENFAVDTVSISGTIVKTRTTDPQPEFNETTDLTITLANGKVIHRTAERTRAWVAGWDTQFNPADDRIEITGNVNVSDSDGNSYSKEITTPLVKTGECKYITEGVIEYKNSNGTFATLDYGDGTCDNLATRTTQDGTTEITLGK